MKALLAGNGLEASRTQARTCQARQRDARRKAKAGGSELVDCIEPEGKWAEEHNGLVKVVMWNHPNVFS